MKRPTARLSFRPGTPSEADPSQSEAEFEPPTQAHRENPTEIAGEDSMRRRPRTTQLDLTCFAAAQGGCADWLDGAKAPGPARQTTPYSERAMPLGLTVRERGPPPAWGLLPQVHKEVDFVLPSKSTPLPTAVTAARWTSAGPGWTAPARRQSTHEDRVGRRGDTQDTPSISENMSDNVPAPGRDAGPPPSCSRSEPTLLRWSGAAQLGGLATGPPESLRCRPADQRL